MKKAEKKLQNFIKNVQKYVGKFLHKLSQIIQIIFKNKGTLYSKFLFTFPPFFYLGLRSTLRSTFSIFYMIFKFPKALKPLDCVLAIATSLNYFYGFAFTLEFSPTKNIVRFWSEKYATTTCDEFKHSENLFTAKSDLWIVDVFFVWPNFVCTWEHSRGEIPVNKI